MLNSKVLLVKLLFKQPCKACLMYICSFNDAFTCSIFRGCLIPILDYLQYDKKCKFFLKISFVFLNIKLGKDIVRRKRRGVEIEVVQFYEYIVNIRINMETH